MIAPMAALGEIVCPNTIALMQIEIICRVVMIMVNTIGPNSEGKEIHSR